MLKILFGSVVVVVLVSTGVLLTSRERATVSIAEGYGARPVLPAANPGLLPTVNIAPAVGWADGETPIVADDFSVYRSYFKTRKFSWVMTRKLSETLSRNFVHSCGMVSRMNARMALANCF